MTLQGIRKPLQRNAMFNHANDVTQRSFEGGNFLFDIETGSLVTYPCPYRIVTLNHDGLEVESRFIAEIDYDI